MADGGQKRRMRLGELLLAAGVLDAERLETALSRQQRQGGRLGRILVDLGYVSEDLMAKALARQLGLPRVDLDRHPIPPSATRWIAVDLCEQYGVFPVARDAEANVLHLATSDPTNHDAIHELSVRSGSEVRPVMATASAIDRAVRAHYYGERREAPAPDARGPGAHPASPPEPASDLHGGDGPAARVAELTRTVERLEQVIEGQGRSLRAVVELLLEGGAVDRSAYLERIRRLDEAARTGHQA